MCWINLGLTRNLYRNRPKLICFVNRSIQNSLPPFYLVFPFGRIIHEEYKQLLISTQYVVLCAAHVGFLNFHSALQQSSFFRHPLLHFLLQRDLISFIINDGRCFFLVRCTQRQGGGGRNRTQCSVTTNEIYQIATHRISRMNRKGWEGDKSFYPC